MAAIISIRVKPWPHAIPDPLLLKRLISVAVALPEEGEGAAAFGGSAAGRSAGDERKADERAGQQPASRPASGVPAAE